VITILIINKRNVWNIEEKVTLIHGIEFGEKRSKIENEAF
jgi:hypothetical protein